MLKVSASTNYIWPRYGRKTDVYCMLDLAGVLQSNMISIMTGSGQTNSVETGQNVTQGSISGALISAASLDHTLWWLKFDEKSVTGSYFK